MIMHHQHQQQQFLNTNLCPNSRPHNDDSTTPPTDDSEGSSNPNSMSTATPPHSGQICMRVSPASTTLMASNNNIDIQPSSRQLSPSGGNSSPSNHGGTGGSSNDHSHNHHHDGHQQSSGGAAVGQVMNRQFACHAKSMSAGVVVSVPGISNNLATATGMNQNNMINHHIASSHNKHQHHQQQVSANSNNNNTGTSVVPPPHHLASSNGPFIHHQNTHSSSYRSHHQSSASQQQHQHQHQQPPPIVFSRSSGHRERHHHRQQLSQPYQHQHQHQQQPSSTLNPHSNNQSHHSIIQNAGSSSSNFLNMVDHHPQTMRRTSIIQASNHHHTVTNSGPIMQSHHNRSSSAQLAGVPLIGGHNNNNNISSRNHHNSNSNSHHTQSNHHMNSTSTTAVACVGHSIHPTTNYTNSIWSIDEHMSKSQNKLASSTYLAQHPYLYNPSITDMSCDNVSQGSRLPDGAPAPGYYHTGGTNAGGPNGAGGGGGANGAGPSNLRPNGSNGLLSASGSLKSPEFLPICDLMFNLISMIVYFCENTFGIIALIALYYHSANQYWAFVGALFVVCSNTVSQYLSFRWLFKSKLEDCKRKREAQEELETEGDCERRYFNRMATNMSDYPCGSCTWLPDSATEVQLKFLISITIDAILHLFCLGFLVRYIKLVIPVKDTARVRKEARDLCMLRMVHGFIQSIPLLLLQAYMICLPANNNASVAGAGAFSAPIMSLGVTSAMLSLVNVCWALASFTKYARKKYLQRFILTWLGILSQMLWRLGTVSSRIVALTIYGVYYNYWMLVVLALHWLTMFLWLMKPGNLLRDEVSMGRPRKISFAAAIAWIYCFCYLNFEEHNSKLKMTSYYLIMFLENNLLLTVCLIFSSQVTWIKNLSILVVYLGFVFGMLFMFIYYKYFHVNVLNNGLSCSHESIDSIANQLSPAGKKIAGFEPGTIRLKSEECISSSNAHKYDSTTTTTNMGANTMHDTGCRRS